jgi:hypothetical protein
MSHAHFKSIISHLRNKDAFGLTLNDINMINSFMKEMMHDDAYVTTREFCEDIYWCLQQGYSDSYVVSLIYNATGGGVVDGYKKI